MDLSARLDGRLERLDVRVGDRVRQGQVLARMDARSVEQDLSGARAALQGARAEEHAAAAALAEASGRQRRYSTAHARAPGTFSEDELGNALYQQRAAAARLESARARIREQQARVAELEQGRDETALVAPFDGVVADCPVPPGTRVTAGQPLVRVLGTGGSKVRFAVPEEAAQRLASGAPLQVRVPEAQVSIPGRVESVAPEVDAAARLVFAIATFDTPPPDTVGAGRVVRVRAGQ